MVDILKLYVSAANDLPDEKEIIGQMVTEIPVTLGWQINHTPSGKNTIIGKTVLDADYHMIIFGEDIRAPVGYELYISRRQGRKPPIFIKKNVARTIAGIEFLKNKANSYVSVSYRSLAEFRKLALTSISHFIINQKDYFQLKTQEYEKITNFIHSLEEIDTELLDHATGADSIILSRERYLPKDGVLIKQPIERLSDKPIGE